MDWHVSSTCFAPILEVMVDVHCKPAQCTEGIRLGGALRPRRDSSLPVTLVAKDARKAGRDGTSPKEQTAVGSHGKERALVIALDR